MPEPQPRLRKGLAAIAILSILVGSAFVVLYYDGSFAQQTIQTTNSTITSLQQTIASLENSNNALQVQVSALSSSPTHSASEAQQIYAASNRS
ncbi:MAG: hypothetical protein OK474_10295, partial [Thaumarchaeota archaeon]|nr:hypothetical protein [Nitrososphaerota archaeon]